MPILFQYIIDFLFPPNEQEIKLRSISIDYLINNCEKAEKTEFAYISALFSYKNPLIKELIWQIKYKRNKYAIKCAAFALYTELNKQNEKVLLIPIPISKKRRKERGYNQTELLIDEILKFDTENKLNKDFDLLIREKDIEKQTFKNRQERIENTKHIFKVLKKENLNQKIIIVDDVTTTGSTLKEARDELLKGEYTNVKTLTIAH